MPSTHSQGIGPNRAPFQYQLSSATQRVSISSAYSQVTSVSLILHASSPHPTLAQPASPSSSSSNSFFFPFGAPYLGLPSSSSEFPYALLSLCPMSPAKLQNPLVSPRRRLRLLNECSGCGRAQAEQRSPAQHDGRAKGKLLTSASRGWRKWGLEPESCSLSF